MAELKFSVKLKEKSVTITLEDGSDKIYKLKELTGDQRAKHSDSFDYTVKIEDGVASAEIGNNFKMPSAKDFLALCFYDEKDILVPLKILGAYPSTMLEILHQTALKLSGMDKDSMMAAKNELKGKEGNGSE